MIERLAELLHIEWLEVMEEQGYHARNTCGLYYTDTCDHCRDGLVPWFDLSEEVKEVNRRGVRRVLKELGITPKQTARIGLGVVERAIQQLVHVRLMLMRGHAGVAEMGVDNALEILGWRLDDGKLGEETGNG